ncbi:MAG: hypothetical protein WEA58_05260 [Balneolaceae bacterium]
MKSLIKNITTVLIIAITFTGVEFAQANIIQADSISVEQTTEEKEALFNHMEKAFVYGLSSDVNGVLESSFHQIILFKATYNDFDSQAVKIALSDIAQGENSHFIKYRAVLTLALLKDQERFGSDLTSLAEMKDKDEAFQFLNDKLNADKYTVN